MASPRSRIAILDDHAILRESLSALLPDETLEVVFASDMPGEFIRAVQHYRPEVVLVDLMIDRLNPGSTDVGWGLIRRLREEHPGVRIVVLTGSQDPADSARAVSYSLSGFLTKCDITPASLRSTVRAVLAGERIFASPCLQSLEALPNEPSSTQELTALTYREKEVLSYLAAGADNLKIAALLEISERTVRAHVSNLYRKLGSENRIQLDLLAHHVGLEPARNV